MHIDNWIVFPFQKTFFIKDLLSLNEDTYTYDEFKVEMDDEIEDCTVTVIKRVPHLLSFHKEWFIKIKMTIDHSFEKETKDYEKDFLGDSLDIMSEDGEHIDDWKFYSIATTPLTLEMAVVILKDQNV